jgi:phage anti-repressor protein
MTKFNKKKFNDLVPISNNDNGLIETINARDLWKYLGVKTPFATWIKRKIEKYGFIEGVNYTTISRKVNRQIIIDYHITIDMAKHCAMTENTPLGMSVRQYYIDRDKQLRELQNDDRNTIEWENKRGESKQIRMNFCEVVSLLIEYAKEQGSENAGFYYSNLTKQVNKSLFRIISLKKIFKNLRDEIDFKQLNSIITLEYILTKNIVIMMDNGVDYKDVYPKLKEICEQFGDLFGKEKPKYITYPEYEQCMDKKTKELFTIQQKQIQQRKAIG